MWSGHNSESEALVQHWIYCLRFFCRDLEIQWSDLSYRWAMIVSSFMCSKWFFPQSALVTLLTQMSGIAGCNSILATSAVIDIDHVDKTSLHPSNIPSGKSWCRLLSCLPSWEVNFSTALSKAMKVKFWIIFCAGWPLPTFWLVAPLHCSGDVYTSVVGRGSKLQVRIPAIAIQSLKI